METSLICRRIDGIVFFYVWEYFEASRRLFVRIFWYLFLRLEVYIFAFKDVAPVLRPQVAFSSSAVVRLAHYHNLTRAFKIGSVSWQEYGELCLGLLVDKRTNIKNRNE